jgi:hypothetical protein
MGSLLEYRARGNPDYLVLLLGYKRKPKPSSAVARIWGKTQLSSAVTMMRRKPRLFIAITKSKTVINIWS